MPGALSRDVRLLITLGSLYVASYSLSGLFVNIFIWRVDHSLVAIGLFNWTIYAMLPVTFVLGGWLAAFVGQIWLIRIGVATLSVFFGLLLWLGRQSAHHYVWLGVLSGLGQGLYWYGFQVLSFDLTTADNRGRFHGVAGVFTSLTAMAGPFFAGYVITQGWRFAGYHLVFATSLALFGVCIWLSFRLVCKRPPAPMQLAQGFRLRADPDWGRLWWATVFFGLREGLFAFYIGLLVYLATGTEEGLGEYALWTGSISLGAFYLAGRAERAADRGKTAMRWAALLMGVVCLVFFIAVNRWTLLLFGTVTAALWPFLLVPFGSMAMNEMDETDQSAAYRSEHVISREIALGIGRIVGVGSFVAVAAWFRSPGNLIALTAVLGFAHTLVSLLVRKVEYNAVPGSRRIARRPAG